MAICSPIKNRIISKISASGPMPFELFMALALYDADGFFGGDTLRSEKGGDFLTSPEVSRLFGETLAVYVEHEHQRIGDPFQMVEVGAGSGSLIRPLVETYPVDTWAVEASPAARKALASVLSPDRILSEMPDRTRGVVIANELIDNMPMALAQNVDGQWRERWVSAEGDGLVFVDADARPQVVEWLEQFAGEVPEGGWVEVQLAAQSWLAETIGRLEAGSILLIDYGDTAENLIPRRGDGTLRTYRSHHLGPHPLDEPGETDITADVNFTALMATAVSAGAEVSLTRQDDFLSELGLRDRLSEMRKAELDAARSGDETERLCLRTLKSEAETLMHPRGLGDFRVLVVSKALTRAGTK